MPVKFRQHQIHDTAGPAVIEDAFRAYANFAAIHDLFFDSLYVPKPTGWVTDGGADADVVQKTAKWDDGVSKWDDNESGWLAGPDPQFAPGRSGIWDTGVGKWLADGGTPDADSMVWL